MTQHNKIESDDDVQGYREAITESSRCLKKQLRFASIATASFLICCFLTYLFLDIGPFHQHWEPFGQIALVAALGTMIAALYYDLLAWGAWTIARATKKDLQELLEDRFGVTDK